MWEIWLTSSVFDKSVLLEPSAVHHSPQQNNKSLF